MDKPARRHIAVVSAKTLGMLALAAACGLQFLIGYGCAADLPIPAHQAADLASGQRDLLVGRWEGKWASDSRGEDGKLKCGIRTTDSGEHFATFVSKYAGGLLTHTSKDVALRITARRDGRWEFEGRKDLGLIYGGMYTYKGYVTPDAFEATYDSRFDKGTFSLQRAADPATQSAGK